MLHLFFKRSVNRRQPLFERYINHCSIVTKSMYSMGQCNGVVERRHDIGTQNYVELSTPTGIIGPIELKHRDRRTSFETVVVISIVKKTFGVTRKKWLKFWKVCQRHSDIIDILGNEQTADACPSPELNNLGSSFQLSRLIFPH